MKLSKKAESLAASLTLEITAKANEMKKKGIDVVSFGAGEPDFNTPDYIKEAAIKAINDNHTRYTATSGIIELKKAIVKKFKEDNGLEYSENQILISTGAKQSLANVFSAILNEGDEVLINIPYWVTYPELVKLNGGVPVFIETKKENSFKFTLKELEENCTERTKAILINSPNNPPGSVYTEEELKVIAEFAREKDLIIISDEIYEKLIYDGKKHISIASLSEDAFNRTIVINGVSKTYAMTGWRIGYSAAPIEINKLMTNIQSHTTSNANAIAQYAALAALEGNDDEIKAMVEEFARRKNYMIESINNIDLLETLHPNGAFYVMVDVSKLFGKKCDGKVIEGSIDFAKAILEKEKVAVIPGIAFGNDNYIRLSYATSMENIEEGIRRIEKFIKSL